jgi:hypothetical protein
MVKLLMVALSIAAVLGVVSRAQSPRIYWGDEVPSGWNGAWPEQYQTTPERTAFTRTTSVADLHEFVNTMKWNSERVHVFNAFTTAFGRIAPVLVLASPRVTTPEEARAAGKSVIFLLGNIHPPEPEGTEALLMLIRDVLVGKKQHLLDNQVLVVLPIFNVDGTDIRATQHGTPHIVGIRPNAQGFDLNRDAVKLETTEVNGLYNNILNRWDPLLFVDLHLMGRVRHGYANTYATSTVPAAHEGPRMYVWDTLFPAVRESVRRDFGLETFTHALADNAWPPTVWSHDNAIWSTEAKFVITDYGLRNRMAIITETPGHPTFERRIYAQYAYVNALLEYTNAHAREMQQVVAAADADTVEKVRTHGESGALRNWLEGKYESWGKVDVLAYRENETAYLPGTSVLTTKPGQATGRPEVVSVEHLTKPVGTREASVPRGYLIPAGLDTIVAKLRTHNIRVTTLTAPMKAEGEQFVVARISGTRRGGLALSQLEGAFTERVVRTFPAGTFFVDLAQPMANAAFYYLEPQAADGFAGNGMFDARLRAEGLDEHPVVYPIFKFRREVK